MILQWNERNNLWFVCRTSTVIYGFKLTFNCTSQNTINKQGTHFFTSLLQKKSSDAVSICSSCMFCFDQRCYLAWTLKAWSCDLQWPLSVSSDIFGHWLVLCCPRSWSLWKHKRTSAGGLCLSHCISSISFIRFYITYLYGRLYV